MARPFTKGEQEFIMSLKENVMTVSSFKCIDKITEFNDCRDTGLKKDKKLKGITDEEMKNYVITKGCYEEYKSYIACIQGVVNQTLDSKEIKKIINDKKNAFTRENLDYILMKEYKLI
jgi:hypothetical protein